MHACVCQRMLVSVVCLVYVCGFVCVIVCALLVDAGVINSQDPGDGADDATDDENRNDNPRPSGRRLC